MTQSPPSLFAAILAFTTHDSQKLFDDLLSTSERATIVNRWRVVSLALLDGKFSQRRIAGQLHVSLGTVSRVNRTLTHGALGDRPILHRLHSTLSTA